MVPLNGSTEYIVLGPCLLPAKFHLFSLNGLWLSCVEGARGHTTSCEATPPAPHIDTVLLCRRLNLDFTQRSTGTGRVKKPPRPLPPNPALEWVEHHTPQHCTPRDVLYCSREVYTTTTHHNTILPVAYCTAVVGLPPPPHTTTLYSP
jgi:hypothetical protein